MKIITHIFESSVGKKFIMAGTGCALFLFVLGHLAGNLQLFLGPEAINRYGHFLQSTPELLWPARIGLLGCVGIHLWTSISLTLENRSARGTAYDVQRLVDAKLASRTMMVTGSIIVAF